MNSASGGAGCSAAAAAGEGAATSSAGGGQVGEGRSKFTPAWLDRGDAALSNFIRVLLDSSYSGQMERKQKKGKCGSEDSCSCWTERLYGSTTGNKLLHSRGWSKGARKKMLSRKLSFPSVTSCSLVCSQHRVYYHLSVYFTLNFFFNCFIRIFEMDKMLCLLSILTCEIPIWSSFVSILAESKVISPIFNTFMTWKMCRLNSRAKKEHIYWRRLLMSLLHL